MRELLVGAAVAAEVAAGYAQESEAARRLDDRVVTAIVDAGFPQHFVPVRHGGRGGGFLDLTRGLSQLGEGCASAAWCAGVFAAVGRMAGFLPERGQAEIWASGPDAILVDAVTPTGTVEPVDDGWRVSGEWHVISGVDHCDWALFAVQMPRDDGVDDARFFAVPRARFSIRASWNSTGMRATGSNTAVLDGVHVPGHLSFDRQRMAVGASEQDADPFLRVPAPLVGGLWFTAPLLGALRGASEASARAAHDKVDPRGRSARENPAVLDALARSAVDADAVEMLLNRVAAAGDALVRDHATVLRSVRDCAASAQTVVAAVDRLLATGGTSAHREGSIVERAWRDAHTGASHVGLRFEVAGPGWSRDLLSILDGERG